MTSSVKLVAVCANQTELDEFNFDKRQIPLLVDEICPIVRYKYPLTVLLTS